MRIESYRTNNLRFFSFFTSHRHQSTSSKLLDQNGWKRESQIDIVPEKLTGLVGTGTGTGAGAVTPFLANHIPSSITNHARPYKTGYVIMLEQRLLRRSSNRLKIEAKVYCILILLLRLDYNRKRESQIYWERQKQKIRHRQDSNLRSWNEVDCS